MEIGLFPLGIVLLPTERIPLHIFEPRYRELIGECREHGRDFGLVLEDEDGTRELGTRAAVIEVTDLFDDGRLNIVVEGRERFRILEETEGRSFRTARVEAVRDGDEEPPEASEALRALDLYDKLVEVADAEIERPEPDAPALSFEIASRVDFGAPVKQELLELRSERARLKRLSELLERAVEALALEREVRERASGNGRVSPRHP